MKKVIGVALIASPLVAWFILSAYVIGIWGVLAILGGIAVMAGVVGLGFWLIDA